MNLQLLLLLLLFGNCWWDGQTEWKTDRSYFPAWLLILPPALPLPPVPFRVQGRKQVNTSFSSSSSSSFSSSAVISSTLRRKTPRVQKKSGAFSPLYADEAKVCVESKQSGERQCYQARVHSLHAALDTAQYFSFFLLLNEPPSVSKGYPSIPY